MATRSIAAAVSACAAVLLLGADDCTPEVDLDEPNARAPYRVGFNHLRVVETSEKLDEIYAIFDDFAAVGAQGARHLTDWDVSWWQAYPAGSFEATSFDLEDSAEVMLYARLLGVYTVPTLFEQGPSAACRRLGSDYCDEMYTPNGEVLDVGKADIKGQVDSYVGSTAGILAPMKLRHYQVGNELDFAYQEADLGLLGVDYAYEVEKYVELVEATRVALRAVDPNARIVVAGLSDVSDAGGGQPKSIIWLRKFLERGGGEHVDVFDFHFYQGRDAADEANDWEQLRDWIADLRALLAEHGMSGKALWMTEVSTSAEKWGETLQAADVFRMFSVAFGNGVELANWHTHITEAGSSALWGGVRAEGGGKYKAYASYQLFSSKLGNFGSCTPLEQGAGEVYAYRFEGALYPSQGEMPKRWVIWAEKGGPATYDLSSEVTGAVRVTSVVPDDDLAFTTSSASASAVPIGTDPVLVEASMEIQGLVLDIVPYPWLPSWWGDAGTPRRIQNGSWYRSLSPDRRALVDERILRYSGDRGALPGDPLAP